LINIIEGNIKNMNIFKKIIFFYLDGFKNMKVGKKLWAIIFSNDSQRANYVLNNLTQTK